MVSESMAREVALVNGFSRRGELHVLAYRHLKKERRTSQDRRAVGLAAFR
jgi:hypothetical protein